MTGLSRSTIYEWMEKGLSPKPAKLSLLIATISLTSCASRETSETSAPSLAAACVVFEPITASQQDTTETIRQIVQHNRVRNLICGD